MTESEQTVYLVELRCNHCEETTTFATKGPAVGVDRDTPWPAVDHCPLCAASYPDDLGWAIQSVHEAEIDDEPEIVTDGGVDQPGTVHVVVTRHQGDPHPKCEGVYRHEEDAERGKREAMEGLGAIAAQVYEMEVRP